MTETGLSDWLAVLLTVRVCGRLELTYCRNTAGKGLRLHLLHGLHWKLSQGVKCLFIVRHGRI